MQTYNPNSNNPQNFSNNYHDDFSGISNSNGGNNHTYNQDKFANLRAISSGQVKPTQNNNMRFWNYDNDGDFMGTIVQFNQFEVPPRGMQYTVVAESPEGELISVFTNDFVREGLRRENAQIGDLVLIQCFGMQRGENFKRYNVKIEKIR